MGRIFDPKKLLVIAGPCSLESESVCREVAEVLVGLKERIKDITIVFKGSFDKANRTSIGGLRGPGIVEGLRLLGMVKKEYGFAVTTDLHSVEQAEEVGGVCDVLQIPAFLCRQTDLLVAAAKTGRVVNVKKGQFLSPFEMKFVVQKLEASGAAEIWQTERGTTFGYQNLIVDMRSFQIMKENGHPTVFDATHSVQLPGAGGGRSGGERKYVEVLALAALAAGAEGLFIETHPEPEKAVSDKETQVPLRDFGTLIEKCLAYWRVGR